MKKISINTTTKNYSRCIYASGIYLSGTVQDTILLESSDFHAGENSYSFIGINAIAGIEIRNKSVLSLNCLHSQQKKQTLKALNATITVGFYAAVSDTEAAPKPINVAQGFFQCIAMTHSKFIPLN
jgi:anthranilate synthase component 1